MSDNKKAQQDRIPVSIIIVAWNALSCIKKCLQSIFQDTGNLDLEVIVVDNNSTEPVVETVGNLFPSVHVIANKTNRGFGSACNQAIRLCRNEIVLFLNPDTMVYPDSIEIMAGFLMNHEEVGALSPTIRNTDSSEHLWYLQSSLSLWWEFMREFGLLMAWFRLLCMVRSGEKDPFRMVSFLTGCCLMMRRSLLEKIGGYDEKFFLYGEDVDLSLRIRDSGFRIVHLNQVAVLHHKAQSTSLVKPETSIYARRSMYTLFRKRNKNFHAVLYRMIVFMGLSLRLFLLDIKKVFSGRTKKIPIEEKKDMFRFIWKELLRSWDSSEGPIKYNSGRH